MVPSCLINCLINGNKRLLPLKLVNSCWWKVSCRKSQIEFQLNSCFQKPQRMSRWMKPVRINRNRPCVFANANFLFASLCFHTANLRLNSNQILMLSNYWCACFSQHENFANVSIILTQCRAQMSRYIFITVVARSFVQAAFFVKRACSALSDRLPPSDRPTSGSRLHIESDRQFFHGTSRTSSPSSSIRACFWFKIWWRSCYRVALLVLTWHYCKMWLALLLLVS